MLHRLVHDLDHRPVQAADVLRRERVAHPVVAQAGGIEDLVAVDVADAGDEVLVHQERLQLHWLGDEHPAEVDPGDRLVERIEPQVGELRCVLRQMVGIADEHLAERAGIDEAKLTARAAA